MNYSRWSSNTEIAKMLTEISVNERIKNSGVQMGYNKNNLLIKDDSSHNLVIASSGSGKTQSVVLPLIRTAIEAEESFVVNDVKGDILAKTSGELKKRGYNITILDYANLKIGNHYNILTLPYHFYKEGNNDKAIALLEDIGYYLIHDNDDNSDIFWENTSIDYFVGLALYLFEKAMENEVNLNSLFYLSNDIFNGKNDYSKHIMEELNKYSSTYQFLSNTLFAPAETRGGIIATFSQRIKKFVSRERLSNMMSFSDFDILNIGNEKSAIFVLTGTSNEANALNEILLNQIFYSIDTSNSKHNRFNFIIDEFDSMKAIKNFSSKINYAKGINIRITAFIKSFTNLNNVYGDKNENLINLCFDNIIYLFSNDIYTLEKISKLCGNTSQGPLVSVEELKVIDMFEEIILVKRQYPIRTKVLPDYKIDWKYDESEVKFDDLTMNNINLFDIEKIM